MQTHPRASHQPLPIRFPPGPAPLNPQPWAASGPSTVSDRLFLSMLGNYRSSGGLARSAEVAALVERGLGRDAGQLERWCAARQVICFEWNAQRWLPRFQFAGAGVLPDPTVALVLAQLNTVFDECEVAQWFATRNPSLADRAPADVIGEHPAAVLEAARGDRFIADG